MTTFNKNFKELQKTHTNGTFSTEIESSCGFFIYELIVNLCDCSINVNKFENNELYVKVGNTDYYHSLFGMMNFPTIEKKFNELVSSF